MAVHNMRLGTREPAVCKILLKRIDIAHIHFNILLIVKL